MMYDARSSHLTLAAGIAAIAIGVPALAEAPVSESSPKPSTEPATEQAGAIQAKPMFVSDKLIVNVYAEANSDGAKVATLESGDAVNALEKADGYTHIKLQNERAGWIKSSYLSAEPPAAVRVKELEKQHTADAAAATQALDQALGEVQQLKTRNAELQAQIAAQKAAPAEPAARQSASKTTVDTETATAQPVAAMEERTAAPSRATDDEIHTIGWKLAWGLAGGALGYALGFQALARRIRRKYGSVKIY